MKTKSSYCNAKSVLFLIVMIVGAALIWSLPVASWYKTRGIAASEAKADKEEIILDVEVLKGDILYETDDTVALLAPAEYKIVRAAYGDDCFYNLTVGTIYGSSEDTISINTANEYTYSITCQPLIGRGEMISKTKTVIVLQPAELRAPEIVLLSQ